MSAFDTNNFLWNELHGIWLRNLLGDESNSIGCKYHRVMSHTAVEGYKIAEESTAYQFKQAVLSQLQKRI